MRKAAMAIGRQLGHGGWTALARPKAWSVSAALLLLLAVVAVMPVLAQNVPISPPNAQQPKPVKRPHAAKSHTSKSEVASPPVVQSQPLTPPKPDWPVNDAAIPASVAWNGRDLMIAAKNASLHQILQDVSTATGLKVDGLSTGAGSLTGSPGDQRIFGSYGPAPARDVLGQLLDGSGYNVLMIGDQGAGTPRELVLTAKVHSVKANPAQPGSAQQNQSVDDEAPEDPEPPEPPDQNVRRPVGVPSQPPGSPGLGGRTPQQMLQEMQQRQQQQQQQQQQNGQPPNE